MSCTEALITRKSGQGPDLRVLDFGVAVLWKLSCLPGKKPRVAGDVSSSFLTLFKNILQASVGGDRSRRADNVLACWAPSHGEKKSMPEVVI